MTPLRYEDVVGDSLNMDVKYVQCPKCQRWGKLNYEGESPKAETAVVPDGFRKVQQGWNANAIMLFCMNCGVPAYELLARTELRN